MNNAALQYSVQLKGRQIACSVCGRLCSPGWINGAGPLCRAHFRELDHFVSGPFLTPEQLHEFQEAVAEAAVDRMLAEYSADALDDFQAPDPEIALSDLARRYLARPKLALLKTLITKAEARGYSALQLERAIESAKRLAKELK